MRVNRKAFYRCPNTGRSSEKKVDGWEYWASTLEYKVYKALLATTHYVIKQHEIELLPACEGFKATRWTPDLYLPETNTLVEAKGNWITAKGHGAAKALMLVHCRLAVKQGYKLCIVSDRDIKLGDLKVQHYETQPWL